LFVAKKNNHCGDLATIRKVSLLRLCVLCG